MSIFNFDNHGKPVKPQSELPPAYQRIEYIDRIRKAYIMYKDIPVARIYHEYHSLSGDFDWVIRPYYDNYLLAESKYGGFFGICGIDEDFHRVEYIRQFNPEFVTQRTIPDCRGDLLPELRRIKLTYNDLFEVMCRNRAIWSDELYVSRHPDQFIGSDIFAAGADFDIVPPWNTENYGWLSRTVSADEAKRLEDEDKIPDDNGQEGYRQV